MSLKRPTVRSDSRRRKICTSTATHKLRDVVTGKVTPASSSLCLTNLLIVESMNCGRTCRVTKGVAQSKFTHDSFMSFLPFDVHNCLLRDERQRHQTRVHRASLSPYDYYLLPPAPTRDIRSRASLHFRFDTASSKSRYRVRYRVHDGTEDAAYSIDRSAGNTPQRTPTSTNLKLPPNNTTEEILIFSWFHRTDCVSSCPVSFVLPATTQAEPRTLRALAVNRITWDRSDGLAEVRCDRGTGQIG